MTEPTSALTRERPDIWRRAVVLASSLTGMEYAAKLPQADGTVYACGGGGGRYQHSRFCGKCSHDRAFHEDSESDKPVPCEHGWWINKKCGCDGFVPIADTVSVPDGAMEWLLHEVGHYLAATPDERTRPNYGLTMATTGLDGEREWQAWAFEEIVLAPFGPARHFAPPTQRDGAAFMRSGPMPTSALHRIERQMQTARVDVAQWRAIWGEWVQWGRNRGSGRAPWETDQ